MDNVISDFIDELKIDKKLSQNTLDSYSRDIKQFMNYLNENNCSFKNVKRTNIIAYMLFLQKQGKATSSILRSVASIRAFYHVLIKNHVITLDPTLNLESPRIEKKIPQILTVEEVDKLLSLPDETNPKGIRDRAMLEVLYANPLFSFFLNT
jgi:integrase/recombinase XerD